MKKKPPKPPRKPATKKKAAPRKTGQPSKVVAIDAKRTKPAKPAWSRKPKKPPMLIHAEYRNQPAGPKLYVKGSIFDEALPDPERVLEEWRKYGKDVPTAAMRRAIVKSIRKGAPVREAMATHGVTEGQFLRWRETAQRHYEAGEVSTPFLDFIRVLEIAEAQGESMTAMDARIQPENTMTFLRARYARNWDGKMSGAPPLAFLKEPEVEVPVEDEEVAYMLSLLENAHGGRKPGETEPGTPESEKN